METVVVWVLCACAFGASMPASAPYRDVRTGAGAVRGYLVPQPPHYAFLGLPYAELSAGRFKPPEPPSQWDGVLEATYRVRCAQPGRRRDPACLVLNVFAPEHAAAAPVLVHVHDGHFATGWGSHTAPPRLLSQGFIVVTLNYRLGTEGFLCLGTNAVPGNAGLKDQVSALSWVHANIEQFGGDPSQVTLYGTGAGAAATELLLLSGTIDSFVQRVILESGSALAPTSLTYEPVATAVDVAKYLGYEDDETKTIDDLAKFYQKISIEKTLNFSHRFMPCVEDVAEYYSALIIRDPKETLQSGLLKSIPLLIAYSKEGSSVNNEMFNNLPNDFEQLLPNNLQFETEDMKFKIAEQVKETYFGEMDMGDDVAESYDSYINDLFTVYPTVKSATLHAAVRSSPVYLMEYLPQGEDDTIYKYMFSNNSLSEEEELVAEKLTTLWSNFMKYSDPTPLKTSLLPELWLPVTFSLKHEKPDISTASCLMFDLGEMWMDTPSSGHVLPIWDLIYDNFYKSHSPQLNMLQSEIIKNEDAVLLSILSEQNTEVNNNGDGNDGGNNSDQNDGEENDNYEDTGGGQNDGDDENNEEATTDGVANISQRGLINLGFLI